MVYGYCRISRKEQNIQRQIDNISEYDSSAKIREEVFTGTRNIDKRPVFAKLMKDVRSGDTIIFDSVSRMSRNSDEGVRTYLELKDRGVNLVFLNEHYCDTETYEKAMRQSIKMTGTAVDCILKGINEYLVELAKEQIKIAFDQAQKEVDDLHKRTKGGLKVARENGKQIGQVKGSKLVVKKSISAKEVIRKHSKTFGGSLSDVECIKQAGISRNSYYKYKREIAEEL